MLLFIICDILLVWDRFDFWVFCAQCFVRRFLPNFVHKWHVIERKWNLFLFGDTQINNGPVNVCIVIFPLTHSKFEMIVLQILRGKRECYKMLLKLDDYINTWCIFYLYIYILYYLYIKTNIIYTQKKNRPGSSLSLLCKINIWV